ncbi:MAG: PilZ domain-containing protein [Sphingomicrobium sp.]
MDHLPLPLPSSGVEDGLSAHATVNREERQVSLYRVGALTVDGRRELCVVRNLSSGGLMLNSYSAIELGSRIAVEFKQGISIRGTVQWSNANSVDVEFDQPIDVAALLASAPHDFRPRLPRIDIACDVSVREGAATYKVRALDISQGGVCVETDEVLSFGADVVVRIDGLVPEPAVVRWCNGNCYGLGFIRLLSVTSLAAWLNEHGQAKA